MDFVQPVQAVIPGAQGRILGVLVETTTELNVRTIARLSGISLAQASRVLPKLVELGLVERRDAPPSALFRLVAENLAARLVRDLASARETVLEELGRMAEELSPEAVSIIVFGSFARGEADSQSDLDVVVVRPADVDEDDDAWSIGVERWRLGARRLTGNTVEAIEVGETEIGRLLRGRRTLWRDVAREGVVVFGSDLTTLKGRHSA
jgi:predicted transcriptional regulator